MTPTAMKEEKKKAKDEIAIYLKKMVFFNYLYYLCKICFSVYDWHHGTGDSRTIKQVFIVGSLSNDDGDDNENGKKAVGSISKTTTLLVHHFFAHLFAIVSRLRRENT